MWKLSPLHVWYTINILFHHHELCNLMACYKPHNEEKMSLIFCLRLVVHKMKITILNHILKKKKKNANQGYMGCEFRSLI